MGKMNKTSIGENFAREYRRRRNWKKVIAVLSCFVVVGTVGALTLPAITMSQPGCGLEEHQHTPECYGEKKVLTCSAESLGIHQHTEECFDGEGNIICHYADFVIHEHDDSCYDGDGKLVCTLPEIEEHQHDGSCYSPEEDKVLDEGHTHTDACYEIIGKDLLCTQQESEGHTHDDSCRSVTKELICGETEREGHAHDETCLDEEGNLICGESEEQGHTHDENCYEEKVTFICGQEESKGHHHTDEECYKIIRGEQLICGEDAREPVIEHIGPELVCGMPEVEAHTHKWGTPGYGCYMDGGSREWHCDKLEVNIHQHTESCFTTEEVLNCEETEHTHTEDCMTDPEADVETPEDWEKTLPLAENLNGEWGHDLLAVAQSQEGYQESVKNFQIAEEGGERKGYTRYGAWYGEPYSDWNMHFLNFCLTYANIPEKAVPRASDAESLRQKAVELESYAAEDYTPQPGDLVFFDRAGAEEAPDGIADSIGIFVEAKTALLFGEDKLCVIEGDYENAVTLWQASPENAHVMGYGSLAGFKAYYDALEPVIPEDPNTAQGEGYTIKLSIPEGALPEGTVTQMEPIAPDSEEYRMQLQTIRSALDVEEAQAWLCDIQFTLNDEKVEPALPITVEVSLENSIGDDNSNSFTAVHITDDGEVEWIEPEIVRENGQIIGFRYLQDNFSSTGIVATGSHEYPYRSEESLVLGDMPIDFYVYAENIETWIRVARGHAGKANNNDGGARDTISLADLETVFGAYGFRALDITNRNGYIPYLAYRTKQHENVGWWNDAAVSGDNMQLIYRAKVDSVKDGYAIAYIPGIDQKITGGTDSASNRTALTNIFTTSGQKFYAQATTDAAQTWYVDGSGNPIGGKGYGDGYSGTTRYIVSPKGTSEPATKKISFNNPVNSDIKVNLFNYGGGIDSNTDGKWMDFYYGGAEPNQFMDKRTDEGGHGGGAAPKMNPTLENGYPAGTYNNHNVNLAYLFSPDGSYDTGGTDGKMTYEEYLSKKHAYQASEAEGYGSGYTRFSVPVEGDGGLFRKDSNGYYIYDSLENAASYNGTTQRFDMYNYTTRPKYASLTNEHNDVYVSNFLPFNDASTIVTWPTREMSTGKPNYMLAENADCWFGMTVEFDFYMPKDGMLNGQPMTFEFHGDDDVWFYLDDVLVLDIGGCHGAQSASLDFSTGVSTSPGGNAHGGVQNPQYQNSNLKTIFENAGKSTAGFSGNTFAPYTKHTAKFFYMERGGNISYCRLKFNMPTLPKESLTVGKDLQFVDENGNLDTEITEDAKNFAKQNLSYTFRVVDEAGNPLITNTTVPLVDANGNLSTEKVSVDANGYFTLKADQRVRFENMMQYTNNQDMAYYVEESIPTNLITQYNGVTYKDGGMLKGEVNETTKFTTYKTDALHPVESNYVIYTNKVISEEMSFLKITKEILPGSTVNGNETFPFTVTLGGNPVPKGTKFVDEKEESVLFADEDGRVWLKAGQTVKLENPIIAGTQFTVTEVTPDGWTLHSITSGHGTVKDNTVTGEIPVNTTEHVTAVNKTYQHGVAIPISKQFQNCSAGKRTATFTITQVKDAQGTPLAASDNKVPATIPELTLECEEQEVKTGEVILGFPKDASGDYFYKVVETRCQGIGSEIFLEDTSVYIFTVNVSNTGATITQVTKDAKEISKDSTAAFVNVRGVVELPAAGGPGTILYTLSGGSLMGLSALMYSKKRKERRKGEKQP